MEKIQNNSHFMFKKFSKEGFALIFGKTDGRQELFRQPSASFLFVYRALRSSDS